MTVPYVFRSSSNCLETLKASLETSKAFLETSKALLDNSVLLSI